MSGLSKDAMLTLRKLFDDDAEFSEFVEGLGGINDEVEQRGLVHREAAEGEQETEFPDPEGDAEDETQDTNEVVREVVVDDTLIETIVSAVVARLEVNRTEEVTRSQETGALLGQLNTTIQGLVKTVDQQGQKLAQLEKGTDEAVTEAIMDLPPRLRERVLVTHRPSQATGQGEQMKSAQEIANSTLSGLPMPELA